jgi:murein DD-endopeptidase MepM/ murein hydrolase activator NlpD
MKIFFVFIISLFIGAHSTKENSVTVFSIEKEEGIELYGKNINYYPVTIELDLNLTNMSSSNKNPVVAIIDGKSEIKLTDLKVQKQNSSWGMKYSYTFYQGSIYAKHDNSFAYRLPFKKGNTHRLDQGYNGDFSHSGDSRFALDFNMDEGTEIHAARQGLIVEFEDAFSKGGNDISLMDKANYVTILHEDGTFGQYSHLEKSGVRVRKGQRVRAGDVIGLSGATGFVTGPHLHFTVLKAKKDGGFVSLPIKFATKDGIQQLEEGKEYIGY